MGLLSKTNPKATWRSVIRRAVVTSTIGTGSYGLIIWWQQRLDHWPQKIAICAILLAIAAALCEWQVPDDEAVTDDKA